MERNEWLYSITEEKFTELVLPIIEASYRRKGRSLKVSNYRAFCGIFYILGTGCPWCALPKELGYWHVIYNRFGLYPKMDRVDFFVLSPPLSCLSQLFQATLYRTVP
jgi:transposase